MVTRTEDGFSCWVNRCAHRGAIVCREKFGNRADHTCVYHQWNYNANGALQGVPFRRGIKADGKRLTGMAKDFQQENFGLRTLRVADFHGLLFATFSEETPPDIEDYLGPPEMQPWVERIVKGRDLEYLGCTRQYAHSNWKLYYENVKDPYHASLLHLFHTTFNIFRVGMKARSIPRFPARPAFDHHRHQTRAGRRHRRGVPEAVDPLDGQRLHPRGPPICWARSPNSTRTPPTTSRRSFRSW